MGVVIIVGVVILVVGVVLLADVAVSVLFSLGYKSMNETN